MTATRDTIVSIPHDVVFRNLDGESVILNLQNGTYYGLDDVGTRMWELLARHRSIAATSAALHDEFDAPRADIEADLIALVDQLNAKGLLHCQ
jgi:coenzyme PQQ synthesis protein D (PqqD)